jgi:uroporphyrinogen decarboxylase
MTDVSDAPKFPRLYTALMGGVPDRVPTAELKVDEPVKEAFLGRRFPDRKADPRGYLEADIEFQLAAGYDYLRVAPQVAYPDHWTSQKHQYSVYSEDVQTRKWAITGQGMIATDEDFGRFPWPDPAQATYEWLEMAGEMLPPGMELITSLKGGGIFERAWMLMGFEGFAVATLENPALVARVIEKTGSIYFHYLRRAFEYPHVMGVWLGDDMAYSTGLMVSPAVHRKWVFPWYQRIAELCRGYDPPKAFIFHSDGLLWEVIPDLIACGVNALHPIDPTALAIGEVKRRYGDKLCLIGNIDLGYTLTRGTPEETREEVRQRIATCAPGGGYVVSSANSVTEYVKLENYKAMLAAVREFGGRR